MNERLVDDPDAFPVIEFAEVCSRLNLRYLVDQAVWNNYHAAFCRYREMQADIIGQIKEELDPQTRSAPEAAEVDVDQLFDPVCRDSKNRDYGLTCNEKTSGNTNRRDDLSGNPCRTVHLLNTRERSSVLQAPTLSLVE
jgi:hypothetical protein